MLHAFLQNKVRRPMIAADGSNERHEVLNWRQLLNLYEDPLTAMLWGRIQYLSNLSLIRLLNGLFPSLVNEEWGALKSLRFWPAYSLTELEDEELLPKKRQYSEPDVEILFEHAALLIEVKPPQGGTQYLGQWLLEIAGWYEDNKESDKNFPLRFLALGRLANTCTQDLNTLKQKFPEVVSEAIGWPDFFKLLHDTTCWGTPQDERIINDCLEVLKLYGICPSQRRWLDFHSYLKNSSLPPFKKESV